MPNEYGFLKFRMPNISVNPSPVSVREFLISPTLSAREAEVLSEHVVLCMEEGISRFQFRLAPDFLPSLGWLERARSVMTSAVEKKLAVELVSQPRQRESLKLAGFHLIADIVESDANKIAKIEQPNLETVS